MSLNVEIKEKKNGILNLKFKTQLTRLAHSVLSTRYQTTIVIGTKY